MAQLCMLEVGIQIEPNSMLSWRAGHGLAKDSKHKSQTVSTQHLHLSSPVLVAVSYPWSHLANRISESCQGRGYYQLSRRAFGGLLQGCTVRSKVHTHHCLLLLHSASDKLLSLPVLCLVYVIIACSSSTQPAANTLV